MVKNFIGAAILGLGIAGFLFILQKPGELITQPAESKLSGNNLVSNKPFVEQLDEKSLRAAAVSQKTKNVTEYFAKELGKTIAQSNPQGPFAANGELGINVPEPELLAENLLADAIQKFDPDSLKPIISEKDLKISNSDNRESQTAYFTSFQQAINESAALLSKKTLSATEINLDQISELILMYDTAFKKLLGIAVPPSLLKIHKKELELLGAKSSIYQAFKNYEEDPLFSIVASQSLDKIDKEFSELALEINGVFKGGNF